MSPTTNTCVSSVTCTGGSVEESGLHKTLIAVDALTDAKLWNVLGAVVDTARAAKQDDEVAFAHVQCDAIVDHIVNGRW